MNGKVNAVLSDVQNKGDEVSWLRSLHECNVPAKTTTSTKAMKPVKSTTTTPTPSQPSRKQEQFECPEPRCSHERNPTCDNTGTIHKSVDFRSLAFLR